MCTRLRYCDVSGWAFVAHLDLVLVSNDLLVFLPHQRQDKNGCEEGVHLRAAT